MPNPVVHWEIQSNTPEKSREFFAQLFDWHIDANNPYNYGIVDTQSDGAITGGIGPTGDGGPGRVLFYVQVDDLQASLDKAESLGAKTIMPPTEIPGVVTVALFSDLEGNTIGLIKG
jgi:predicted enzyme related to lactoylglutathione lyase